MRIINWLFEHIGLIIFLIVGISVVRNIIRALGRGEDGGAAGPRPIAGEDPEAAERTRRVQEEIRRKIAERRALTGEPTVEKRQLSERLPPLVRPTAVPPLDPFGGPMRKIIRNFEEAAEANPVPRWDEAEEEKAALARQQQLAEKLRALEVAREAERRRAAEITARKEPERPVEPLVIGSHASWRQRLRDPREVRRAVVLREILGAPVGLR